MTPLGRLRLRLTIWYAAVVLVILGLLGGGLFLAIRRQMSRQLDASLERATAALIQAARIREVERARATGPVADAVDELHITDRSLYLLDADGHPIKPAAADQWIEDAAREAARRGVATRDFETPSDHLVRLHAVRFTGTPESGNRVYVAAAVADRLELEDQYASLIEAFAAAALAALLLVAGGSYVMVRQATAPVERSMDQMRRFVADAAHELRTPITILRTRAEVALAERRDADRDAATLDAIAREAARLGDIAADLLTLAHADAGERPLARESVYLDDTAADAVDAVRALAERKSVSLEVGSFEEAKVTGDPALIRRLLLIVLDNAIKFTPAGGRVRLDVSVEDGRAAVVVADTGVGIPAAQLPHVFERFYRGDAARRASDGAGLGLAIARWIAELHHASIDITSQAGAGTRVALGFPVAGPHPLTPSPFRRGGRRIVPPLPKGEGDRG